MVVPFEFSGSCGRWDVKSALHFPGLASTGEMPFEVQGDPALRNGSRNNGGETLAALWSKACACGRQGFVELVALGGPRFQSGGDGDEDGSREVGDDHSLRVNQ